MVIKNGPSFAGFGGVGEESVDSGGDNLSEAFRKKDVFEPFTASGLSGSFLFGGAFDDGVLFAVGDCLVGFEKVVGERWVVPPWVVLAWLVFWDGEV